MIAYLNSAKVPVAFLTRSIWDELRRRKASLFLWNLRYKAGILGHSMTEMKAFFISGPNTLKIRSMVFRLVFRISAKKSRSLQCDIL